MSQNVVNEVRDRTDIVELINPKVPLKRAGRNYKGLCPFHQEKTPSFVVFPDQQNFRCFGCQKHGDAFTFYMQTENASFGEALAELARRAGVELPATRPVDPLVDQRREQLVEFNNLAATYFANLLATSESGSVARAYIAERGLDEATVARFQIGAAGDSWDGLTTFLEKRGTDLRQAAEAGLLQEREAGGYYDRFRSRLIYPIRDHEGVIAGFGARSLAGQDPKYLNTPQTPLFDKSRLLYALPEARDAIRAKGQAIIVEGYMDVLAAHQFGEANVVASMGTAITEVQIDYLKRLSRNIVFALDADSAGRMATIRSLESAPQALETTEIIVPDPRTAFRIEQRLNAELAIAELPAGEDPDSLIRSNIAAWHERIASATPYMAYLIDAVVDDEVRENPIAKREAIERLLPILRLIPDAVEQDHYLNSLSQKARFDYVRLKSMLRQSGRPGQTRASAEIATAASRTTVEDYLVALLLKHRALVSDQIIKLPLDLINDPRNRTILQRMLMATGDDLATPQEMLADTDDQVQLHAEDLLGFFSNLPPALPTPIRLDFEASLVRLEREQHEQMVEHLRAEIADSERRGELEGAASLAQQLAVEVARHKEFYPKPSSYFSDIRSAKPVSRRRVSR